MRKKKVYVKVFHSFEEAERFSFEQEIALSPEERLSSAQFLREQYYKMRPYESRKGFRRFFKVVQRA